VPQRASRPHLTPEGERRLPAAIEFARLHLESQDIDPLYPVLRELQRGMGPEQALWHSLLYVAYYNVASSTLAFANYPEPAAIMGPLASLPTGIERRGLRGGAPLSQHTAALEDMAFTYGGLRQWLTRRFTGNPRTDWNLLQHTFQEAWGNGRWAGYKTAEVLMKVNGFPLEATDMGNAFSTGPRQGLALFYTPIEGNTTAAVRELDEQGWDLHKRMAQEGVHLGIEQLETVLCDFHAMAEGRYYVGWDIDSLQEQLDVAWQRGIDRRPLLGPVWAARKAGLPHRYLGELNGWKGVDRARGRQYRDTGRVLGR